MKLLKPVGLILFFVIVYFSLGCSATQAQSFYAEKGVLDLTQWDFNRDGNVQLNGEWEFYWSQLLTSRGLQLKKPDLYVKVPEYWNSYKLNGKNLPGKGYATYRLRVKTNLPPGTLLGLELHTFSSAYKLFVNEKPIASNGRVAQRAADEIGEYRPQGIVFVTPARDFDILLQVSNFQYARGGFWYTVSMGSAANIMTLHSMKIGKELFLLGALLIISIFFFAIYFLRKELKYTLYFALLCLAIAIGVDGAGQFILYKAIDFLSFSSILRIWYSSPEWILLLLILYVHELYKSKLSAFITRVYFVICVVLQCIYFFTPPAFFSRLGLINNYIEIIGLAGTIVIVGLGIKNGAKGAWLNIASMAVVGISYGHDVLYWTNVLHHSFGETVYIGILLFVLLQMIVQAQRIKIFHEQKTAAELAFLQAQIKPHFLYNALNTFISISHFDMDKARELLTDLGNYLRKSFDFRDLSQFVPLKSEIELAKAYTAIEKARFEERIEVNFEVPEDLEVRVPRLVLQPLIENALIHGILPRPEGGKVTVSVKRAGNRIHFSVKDNGVGMPGETLGSGLRHKSGRGIGLANIDSRIRKLFGKGLEIVSPDTGTEIRWSMPINTREDRHNNDKND